MKLLLRITGFNTNESRAYWAAIFDGEGYITLRNQANCDVRALRVGITQGNWPFLNWLKERFGGYLAKAGSAQTWEISFNNPQDSQKFLLYIEPYVTMRYTELIISLKLCEIMISHQRLGGHIPLEGKVVRLRLEKVLEEAARSRREDYIAEV